MDQRVQAVSYLKEAEEAMRVIQANGWTNLTAGTYHPVVSVTTWALAVNIATISGTFTRQIVISDVYRDVSGNIATASGIPDPSTKKVDITVSWSSPIASSVVSSMFLTRYGNTLYTETLAAAFNAGKLTSTQVTTTAGGEVTLSNNNKAKWCTPAFSSATIDLPDGPPVAVSAFAHPTDISIPNNVFVATAPYATSSIKMAFVNVTANTDPPVPSLHGIFTLDPAKYSNAGLVPTGIGLDNNFKTNDIKYYKAPSGKIYALMATNLADHEVIAIQVNNGSGDSFQDSTNKIYKYWTYFNTKIYNAAFNSPSADSPETTNAGDNNGYESSPTNAYINDGSFATDTNSGTNTNLNCTDTGKDRHRFYNYDFSIPTGATINGIEADLVAKADSTTGTPRICVQLSWDGGTTWTAAKTSNNLTTSSATYVLGGAADNWGRTWNDANFSNTNFRVRIIDVSGNNSRDFSLDWVGVKVYYNGISSMANDQEPFGYGARSVVVLGDTGYVISGGYLYAFDLSNIDTKSASSPLDQLGCRIQLDGYDCSPGTNLDKKYSAGQTGAAWGDTAAPVHADCSDGGNIELYADNHIYPVQVGGNKYVYVAVGAGTNPEFEIVNATSIPDAGSTPSISSNSCGRTSGGNSAWQVISSLDFNPNSNTEEAANSVYASADGSRAYISSNGGIDGNSDGIPDSDQFYILNTNILTTKIPTFISTWGSNGSGHQVNTASSGFYNGSTANIQMHPRRSLTVLNGLRVVLVGKDATVDANNAQEYQVLNNEAEATPTYCGGVDYDSGFNDLTSVSEADGDNFVYMVANTNEKQLKIIQGGADNAIYVAAGTFESQTYDAGSNVMFNSYFATTSIPANTSISYQVAVKQPVSGNCSTVTFNNSDFVGPSGTSNDSFTGNSNILPRNILGNGFLNPGRCMRYRVSMTSSLQTNTPTLYDFNVNYSP